MKLSAHFDLAEFTRSESAKRHGVSNEPTPDHQANLKVLCEKVLEPVRIFNGGPLNISSGYRSKALNHFIGGALKSDHSFGCAADIDQDGTSGTYSNNDIFHYIKDNLKFKQLIAEFPKDGKLSWVHISYDPNNLKQEILIAKEKIAGRTIYVTYKGNENLVK
jgi:zinc D-Ala-D-Ala carboxypeptidase